MVTHLGALKFADYANSVAELTHDDEKLCELTCVIQFVCTHRRSYKTTCTSIHCLIILNTMA